MLGRRVEPVAAAEGPEFMEAVRFVVSEADIAAANLESPLTDREHVSDNPNVLIASPELAPLLAGVGLDLVSVANNHATDAGSAGLEDTLDALDATGVAPLGGGRSRAAALAPVVLEHGGVRVSFLAFDATRIASPATDTAAGVARYDDIDAQRAVGAAATTADVVVVSLHGGVEYLLDEDPILTRMAADLVEWGADVVWGHGSHVPQPVTLLDGTSDRPAVVATSLGNLVFDQQRPATQKGLLLEVVADPDGLLAYRVGWAEHPDLRPAFVGWDLPQRDAALIDGEWWSLIAPVPRVDSAGVRVSEFPMGDVTTAAIGDVTGNGSVDLVVSYRHPFRANQSNEVLPARDWTDGLGRSAHLGVFDSETLEPIWAAGTMLRPVADLAVCDGSVALTFDSLDDPRVVATGAWVWSDFGFTVPDELPGPGVPQCADVDADGSLDPVIDRSLP
jgi:hypothetical protein